jgi:hypothetical protein
MHLRTLYISIGIAAIGPVGALADATSDFVGPTGWSHVDVPSTDPNRVVNQWHIPGDEHSSLTFIKDTTSVYADALSAIEKNFSTNGIKPGFDKDVPCHGKTGHQVEFVIGPDGHQITINRILVPDGTGIDTITYARENGDPFDPDVKKAETAFCALPGT